MKNLNKKGLLGYILGIVLLCLIDQLTKIAAVSALKGKSPFVLIKNVLEFYYLENTGMAIVIIFGLTYATLMTLYVVPLMYDILFKKPPLNVDIGDENLDDIPDDAAEYIAQNTAQPE